MRGARNLWVSIVFVGILVAGSITAFATGTRPVLGLDLQGGLSVILAAPPGTPSAVMQQALENIRRRVDALGVGEPLLYPSGTNIEVQLPGLAPGKITNPSKSLYCIVNKDGTVNYGCASDQTTATSALSEIRIQINPTTICVTDANGNVLGAPKGGPSPTPTPSLTPSAST